MVKHPITIRREGYHGRDISKCQKVARYNTFVAEIEQAINALLLQQTEPVQVYDYFEISQLTGYSQELVREACFSIDGGHNGFTAIRHDLTYEQAMAANANS